MRTVFKTKLDVCDFQTIELPRNFRMLHIGMQCGEPCIWYECDTDEPLVELDIFCFGTGHPMDKLSSMIYIGTVNQNDDFIWHFYRAPFCREKADIKLNK